MVCVRTFPSRAVAEIARGALRTDGIQAAVSAEDTAWDITLAHGGAQLLVEPRDAEAAREILVALDSGANDRETGSRPLRFHLSAIFALTTLSAAAAAGYAYNDLMGAISLFFFPVFAFLGVQILRCLEGRRPLNKFFVAVAGLGFLSYAVFLLATGLFGLDG